MPNLKTAKNSSAWNNNSPLRVVPLRPEDAEAIAALHASCFERSWNAKDFRRYAGSTSYCCFVALHQKDYAGFILANHAAGEAEVLTFGVSPDHRRQSVGSRLLKHLLAELAGLGVESVFLEVGATNDAARQLYENFGFERAGHRPGYYRKSEGAEDALILRRKLK